MSENKPGIIEIPQMNYIAVRGKGNPNEENGDTYLYNSGLGERRTVSSEASPGRVEICEGKPAGILPF